MRSTELMQNSPKVSCSSIFFQLFMVIVPFAFCFVSKRLSLIFQNCWGKKINQLTSHGAVSYKKIKCEMKRRNPEWWFRVLPVPNQEIHCFWGKSKYVSMCWASSRNLNGVKVGFWSCRSDQASSVKLGIFIALKIKNSVAHLLMSFWYPYNLRHIL